MHSVLLIIFVLCVLAVLHSYVFYPLFMVLFTSQKKESAEVFAKDPASLPSVDIIMAAYNEEKVIDDKIRSVFETSYPLNKIRFFIGSDASTDRTDEIIKKWQEKYPQLVMIQFRGRTGKSGIINHLSTLANADVLILTDANVIFTKETIFNLVRHFKDPKKLQVCANIVKVSGANEGIATQEKSYIAFENKLKFLESQRWKMVMGAEGACYAIRRSAWSPVPPKFYMDDFYITMNVIEQEGEIVFDREAVCYEDVPTQAAEEFKRKVRISIGNFQNLFRYKKLLWPPWKGSAFAFWSHKVLRWLTPFFMIIAFICSVTLAIYYPFFMILAALQALGFLFPLFDKLLDISFKPLRFISHFYLMNYALLKGFIVYANGVESNVWQPTQRNV